MSAWAKDVISWMEGCARFTVPKTNQILIEALMRGHSARWSGEAEGTAVKRRACPFALN